MQVLTALNAPDTHEGLTTGRYTAEKAFGKHRVYVYYYRTLPLNGKMDEVYAIVGLSAIQKPNMNCFAQKRKAIA